jgi:phospholipid transport system substrate-binding protein
MSKILLALCTIFTLSVVQQAAASEPAKATVQEESSSAVPAFDSEAHNRVQQITVDLLATIESKSQYLETDPEVYFSAVDTVLGPVIDFKFISKVVMGRYGKSATAEQKALFEQNFRRGLVETYAKGMAGYADQNIVVLPPSGDVSAQRRVSVRQQVSSANGDTHTLAYTMALSKTTKQWMLINVVMDGINLGKTFRSQFEQAVKKNNGDVDTVISQWLSPKA